MTNVAPARARAAGMKGAPAVAERSFRRALALIAFAGLALGVLAWAFGRSDLADWCWAAGTAPVIAGLLFSMIRDFLADRMGVDAVAFVSMSGALALAQYLAGVVIARPVEDVR